MQIDQIIKMDSSSNGTFGNSKSNDTCEINLQLLLQNGDNKNKKHNRNNNLK